MEQELQDSRSVEYGAAEESGGPSIFRSEYDYISSCILDYPDIETGGQTSMTLNGRRFIP